MRNKFCIYHGECLWKQPRGNWAELPPAAGQGPEFCHCKERLNGRKNGALLEAPSNGSKILIFNLKLRSSCMPGTWLFWMSYVLVAGKSRELGRAVWSLRLSPLLEGSHPVEVSDVQLFGAGSCEFPKMRIEVDTLEVQEIPLLRK